MTKIYQELVEKLAEQKKPKKRFFNFVDSCISLFVVSPLVVGFWKGIWCLINYYHDELDLFPVLPYLLLSYTSSSLIYYSRDALNEFIIGGSDDKEKSMAKRFRRAIFYRIYHYIFAASSIMIWRCLWELPPLFFEGELSSVDVHHVLSKY
jgi:hypothetical protein